MEAQDQQIGLRVFWTIGFLGLGTLSAIGAAALFPWYLAVVIAILVVGMASACAIQLRVTRNILYLVSMLAMTCLASFLDGVSVWEILNNRQNTLLRGIQAVQGTTDDQSKAAETRVQDLRNEIASLNEEAQNMDNDGNVANDKLIPGLLAKIESKKADLPNLEAKAEEARAKVVEAASKVGVSSASRHFFLQLADQHENPALWLISCASLAFLVPELTLALLAWSLKGNKREEMRPQPVVIVSHAGGEHGQAQMWQAMPSLAAAPMAMPQMTLAYPQQVGWRDPVPVAPPPQMPAPPAYACPTTTVHQAPQVERRQESPAVSFQSPVEAAPAPDTQMGLGQWMMTAAADQGAQAPSQTPPVPVSETPKPQAVHTPANEVESPALGGKMTEEEVMLSPDSVPEQESMGIMQRQPVRAGATGTSQKAAQNDGRERPAEAQPREAVPGLAHSPGVVPSVLESTRNMNQNPHSQKSSPTKMAKNAAAKRSKKSGMRSRGTSLAELASRLN